MYAFAEVQLLVQPFERRVGFVGSPKFIPMIIRSKSLIALSFVPDLFKTKATSISAVCGHNSTVMRKPDTTQEHSIAAESL